MELKLKRINSNTNDTIGLFYINDKFECFTLEDEKREVKVKGKTRIPAGRYKVELRTEGGLTKRYAANFPKMHKGMLWLRNVPDFQYIYLHVGNKHTDTDGCPLLGDTLINNLNGNGFVGESRKAYQRVYPKIADVISAGKEEVWITVEDE